ncbi:hypothetical protein JOC37_001285 [Desulfohalotomaculum tongense]|uniref:hypothetical protein n=1 Tax=Desulforadius tongensis TaxID=1216062 RepID=UPI00195DAA5A|nr:hypothetical protein [Desulforadius tongensis]
MLQRHLLHLNIEKIFLKTSGSKKEDGNAAIGRSPSSSISHNIKKGGSLAPQITGIVQFKDIPGGTWVCVDVTGIPPYQPAADDKPPPVPTVFTSTSLITAGWVSHRFN